MMTYILKSPPDVSLRTLQFKDRFRAQSGSADSRQSGSEAGWDPARQIATILLIMGMALYFSADLRAAESEWAPDHASQFRILLAEPKPSAGGDLIGGIEIQLEPGWHTYWRTPGEAGMPPRFDFSASENISEITVRYPVPERYQTDGGVSVVYHDHVVFPLQITPADPAKPVTLDVSAVYGVCEEVCIPVQSAAAVTLAPGAPDSPLARISIGQFERRVPEPFVPEVFDIEISETAPDGDAVQVRVLAPDPGAVDLFVDPPPEWYLAQPSFKKLDGDVAIFRLSLAGRPADQDATGGFVRFVAISGGSQIEKTLQLPQ